MTASPALCGPLDACMALRRCVHTGPKSSEQTLFNCTLLQTTQSHETEAVGWAPYLPKGLCSLWLCVQCLRVHVSLLSHVSVGGQVGRVLIWHQGCDSFQCLR